MQWDALPLAGATILAVAHKEFLERPLADFAGKTVRDGCLVDVKSKLDPAALRALGLRVWRL